METHRDEYTINPETGRKIKIGTQTWKRLAAKYYMIDGKFTDQTIPDSRAYLSNKAFGLTINEKGKNMQLNASVPLIRKVSRSI